MMRNRTARRQIEALHGSDSHNPFEDSFSHNTRSVRSLNPFGDSAADADDDMSIMSASTTASAATAATAGTKKKKKGLRHKLKKTMKKRQEKREDRRAGGASLNGSSRSPSNSVVHTSVSSASVVSGGSISLDSSPSEVSALSSSLASRAQSVRQHKNSGTRKHNKSSGSGSGKSSSLSQEVRDLYAFPSNDFIAEETSLELYNDKNESKNPFDDENNKNTPTQKKYSAFYTTVSALLEKQKQPGCQELTEEQLQAIKDDIHADFTELLMDQFAKGSSPVEAHLHAAQHLWRQFWDLDDLNNSNATRAALFGQLEAYLYPRVSVTYTVMDDLTPKEAATLLTWIGVDLIGTVWSRAPSLQLQDAWKEDCERLSKQYLDRAVRLEMRRCLHRAWELQTQEDVRQDDKDCMVTGLPESVAFMYQQQIQTAQQSLPKGCGMVEQVVAVCNEELSAVVADMQLKIGSQWKEIPAYHYCAMINDANRLATQCEERNEEYLADADEEDEDEEDNEKATLAEKGEELVRDLAELSLHATNFLGQRILYDLTHSNILTSVGDVSWETDKTSSAMETTIATFKDFFSDLEMWLADTSYYFPKVLKACFERAIQVYLESFFGNTIVHGIRSAQDASAELQQDYVRLVVFFNGPSFEKYHGAGGFYGTSDINQHLRILQNMAAILSPDNAPAFVHEDILAVLERFSQGGAAVLHLAGLRQRHRGPESALWVKEIAAAQKELVEEGKRDARQATVTIPDLRNSKYIHNIRPFRQPLERIISESSRPHADATLQLLETHMPLYQKARKYANTQMEAYTTTVATSWVLGGSVTSASEEEKEA